MADASFDQLWHVYEEHCAFGGMPVRDFIEALRLGEYGSFEESTLVQLLEKLRSSVLENIDMMAEQNPALLNVVDEKKEEQSQFYQKLINEVRTQSGKD